MKGAVLLLSLILAGCTDKDSVSQDSDPPVGDDSAAAVDADGDGVFAEEDCDDTDPTAFPGAAEVCDGVDNDCDGEVDVGAGDAATWYADADSDGHGDEADSAVACEAPEGYVAAGGDCDDRDASVNPDASEVCDAQDQDCDGAVDEGVTSAFFRDGDGDGFGDASLTTEACAAPEGYVADSSDCDDANGAVNPAADERCATAYDDNCDGDVNDASSVDLSTWYADGDGDGYGDARSASQACDAPSGTVSDASDCDDSDGDIHPGASEPCSGGDRDCDGVDAATCASCLELLNAGVASADGLYDIDPDGSGVDVEVWCDMSTDGGGWTLAQRTVWDWADSSQLMTTYSAWYADVIGDADAGNAFRLPGGLWDELNVELDHMFVHYGRDASSGADCSPLYYLGTGGVLSISSSSTTISGLSSTVTMVQGSTLSTTDTGPSTVCPNTYDAVPWFYTTCCTTCPTFHGSYWNDEAHPMVSYLNTTADHYGLMDSDVCPSGRALPNDSGSSYEGINAMEYYLR